MTDFQRPISKSLFERCQPELMRACAAALAATEATRAAATSRRSTRSRTLPVPGGKPVEAVFNDPAWRHGGKTLLIRCAGDNPVIHAMLVRLFATPLGGEGVIQDCHTQAGPRRLASSRAGKVLRSWVEAGMAATTSQLP